MGKGRTKMVDLLKAYQYLMRQIQEGKDGLVKEVMNSEHCPRCTLPVKTAKWMIPLIIGEPLMERLLCICSEGHEWYAGGEDEGDGLVRGTGWVECPGCNLRWYSDVNVEQYRWVEKHGICITCMEEKD